MDTGPDELGLVLRSTQQLSDNLKFGWDFKTSLPLVYYVLSDVNYLYRAFEFNIEIYDAKVLVN